MNNRVKDNTMNFIVDEATALFLQKSIIGVKMSEIASTVGIGDATLYRYFRKKQYIVIQSAAKLAENVIKNYFQLDKSLNGLDQLKQFYGAYLRVFKEHKEYFKFINELDAYILTETDLETISYEEEVDGYKAIFDEAYKKGIEDGSVRAKADPDTFYYATAHSLLNLCKNLSKNSVLQQDDELNREAEIDTMVSIINNSL